MTKHAAPIVVRLWADGYSGDSINAYVHDWDSGDFTIEASHPLAAELWRRDFRHTYVLTVLSTAELEWSIDCVIKVGGFVGASGARADRLRVECRPRQEQLRKRLISDEWLISNGLVA